MIEEILEFCGYKEAYTMLWAHMDDKELNMLLQDLVNSPEDAVDFVKEEVEKLATQYYERVDRDALMLQAEDMAYAKYRDGE